MQEADYEAAQQYIQQYNAISGTLQGIAADTLKILSIRWDEQGM